METCLLPLTIPESLFCRTLAQILGQWQLDTYTLPNNIHTASRTCLSGLRQEKEKNNKKKNLPPTKQQIRRNHPEEPQERELSTFHGEATAQESLPSKNWIKIFITQLASLKPGSIKRWLLEGTFALCFGREIQLQHTAAASLKERRQRSVSFLCFCPHFQASWLAWTGDLSRHVDIPEWNGTICGLWDFVLKHHCWCVCSDCCSVYGRKWIQALG